MVDEEGLDREGECYGEYRRIIPLDVKSDTVLQGGIQRAAAHASEKAKEASGRVKEMAKMANKD